MKPVRTPFTNANFKLVGGTDKNDLPIQQDTDENGNAVLMSIWELDDDERSLIAAGARVRLVVWGIGTPPVALDVEDYDA